MLFRMPGCGVVACCTCGRARAEAGNQDGNSNLAAHRNGAREDCRPTVTDSSLGVRRPAVDGSVVVDTRRIPLGSVSLMGQAGLAKGKGANLAPENSRRCLGVRS